MNSSDMTSKKNSFLKPLLWLGTRSITVYLMFTLLTNVFIDFEKVQEKSRVKLLNDLMPDFGYLLSYQNQEAEFDQGWFNKYLNYYKKVDEFIPGQPDIYAMLAYCYYQLGDVDNAMAYYQKAAALFPQNFWFQYNLGVLYYKQGDYDRAVVALNAAVDAKPEPALKLTLESIIYEQIIFGMVDKKKVMAGRLFLSMRDSYLLLILSHFKKEDYKNAFLAAKGAIQKGMVNETILYYCGLTAFQLKEYQQSIIYLKKFIEINPRHGEATKYLALSLKELGQEDYAIKLFKKAMYLEREEGMAPLPEDQIHIHLF